MSSASIESSLRDVRELIDAGRLSAAGERCASLAQAAPNDSRIWVLSAEVSARSNNLAATVDFLRRAVDCAPDDAPLLIRYGLSLLRLGRRQEALAVALRAGTVDLNGGALDDALGTLFTHVEEPALALPHFQRAVQSEPTNIDFRHNLAMAQRMVGAFAAAEANLDQVIAARPEDGEAYNARSDIRRQTPEHNHVAEMEAVLPRVKNRRARLAVEFALAKELEDIGEYSRSFAHLRAACQSFRSSVRYDVAEDVAVLDKLRTSHTASALRRLGSGLENGECIFIVGLPRSGTTLVERILGSHSEVYAAGELNVFSRVAIEAAARQAGGTVKKLEFVDTILKLEAGKLGRAYIEGTRPGTGHTARFTDKTPLNYLYSGVIHAALPRGRFVALRRHPMDSCYAMYKTLFANAYPFSYDLMDLARYYVAWERMMRHWQEVIGEAWLPLSYEELVANQENVTRKMLAHCGLAWENACLDFYLTTSPVTTASAAQVRRPLYPDSVGRWRAYATELEPLASYLEANGIQVG
jgi:tetratricopeptide (TPR) repeat protein